MKTKGNDSFLWAFGLALALLFGAGAESVRACDGCTNKVELKIPETAAGILQTLHEHNAYLAGIIRANTLPRASPVLVNMRLFARALPAKAPGDKKAAVDDEVKHFLETAKELAKSALRENKAASASQLSTLQERLKTLSAFFHYQPTNGPAPQPKATRRI